MASMRAALCTFLCATADAMFAVAFGAGDATTLAMNRFGPENMLRAEQRADGRQSSWTLASDLYSYLRATRIGGVYQESLSDPSSGATAKTLHDTFLYCIRYNMMLCYGGSSQNAYRLRQHPHSGTQNYDGLGKWLTRSAPTTITR